MAPSVYPRARSAFLDPNYETATEKKINEYARYYGIKLRRGDNGYESDYSLDSSRNFDRSSESRANFYDDRRSAEGDYYARRSSESDAYSRQSVQRDYSASSSTVKQNYNYSSALVAANSVDERFKSMTPPRELYQSAYGSSSGASRYSSDNGLHDVLSYTRNVLGMIGTGGGAGNVRVHLNYRPVPPVYNYSPTHKHYHVYSPNNYYTAAPAVTAAPAFVPQPPIYHHHYHYPTKRTTETTIKTYYVPRSAVPSRTASYTTNYETLGESSASSEMRNSSSSQYRESASMMRDSSSQMKDMLAIRSGRATTVDI